MLSIQLKVNGELQTVEIEPAETLLHVLREKLGLTGTKEGCGEGDCGACTILVDGKSVNSCIYPAIQADGCEILTVEGVEKSPKLMRIQKAFVDHGAVLVPLTHGEGEAVVQEPLAAENLVAGKGFALQQDFGRLLHALVEDFLGTLDDQLFGDGVTHQFAIVAHHHVGVLLLT